MTTSLTQTTQSNQLRSVIESYNQKCQQLDTYLKHQVFTTRPWIPAHNEPVIEAKIYTEC